MAAITGRSKRRIVLAGTPDSTAVLMAYFIGFFGHIEPNTCSSNIFSKGPKVSLVGWVISLAGTTVSCGVGKITGVGVGLNTMF